MASEHVRRNRAYWDAQADAYQEAHGARLEETAMAWGVWRIAEAEVGALGDVRGKDVLELGCGAAQWSVALAGLGARPTGVDVSEAQLAHARRAQEAAGVSFPLALGSAEELPFEDGSFDVVFADHGAMGFIDPRHGVPEAARVLRAGGLLAFCGDTPLHFICWDEKTQTVGTKLREPYFEPMETAQDEETAQFQLPYGEWIRLFRQCGLVVEDLLELRPPEGAKTTYEGWVGLDWARRWPAEQIWRLRKGPALVGVAEAARLLGWDKRRVATYVVRGSFPKPVAELAGGRVWRLEDVLAFAGTRRRRG